MSDERIQREAEFHDHLYAHDREARAAAAKYYSVIDRCRDEYLERISTEVKGKRVLEYGCGPGGHAGALAAAGAHVTAIDISPEALKQARKRLKPSIELLEMNAEAMTFEHATFDLVCGTGVLHHLDLSKAFREISRVLRPGGRAVFIEPLGHNPVINLYRRLTPSMRSDDEHPLMMSDFEAADRIFASVDLSFYNLTTLAAVPLRKTKLFEPMSRALASFDDLVMARVPFARRYAWNVLIDLRVAAA
ncbi:MAG: class I SAM-dependent methyltransferase [Acidimicrobiia bacterium]|nr:class I SAM-dependent methyltransferase [Acidimicrobiia bacterium]